MRMRIKDINIKPLKLNLILIILVLSSCGLFLNEHLKIGTVVNNSSRNIQILLNCKNNINDEFYLQSSEYVRVGKRNKSKILVTSIDSRDKNKYWNICIFDIDSINNFYNNPKRQNNFKTNNFVYKKYLLKTILVNQSEIEKMKLDIILEDSSFSISK